MKRPASEKAIQEIIARLTRLEKTVFGDRTRSESKGGRPQESKGLDFGMPLRPFVKSYCKGLSGSRKFTLLLSWLAKGDPKKEIPLSEIQAEWGRMTSKSLLGMQFNHFFTAEARENDWVELKKKGLYSLRPSWRGIFKS